MKQIRVGLVGFGTIGAGVAKALIERRAFLRQRSGVDIILTRVCDKDIKSKRAIKLPKSLLTSSLGKILYDPDIDIVVELVGGINPAKDIVAEALRQGKHVVTANKALLSEEGNELFGLASTLGLSLGFEASVGGGIPIIKALREGFIANRIELVYGIINGTSNFILSQMSDCKLTFSEALKRAQERGYAEKDPTLDVNGTDSAHKLSILALLGFGVSVNPSKIYVEGITRIEPNDIQYARDQGYTIKLLAIAKSSGAELQLRVHPTMIPSSHLLANVSGVYNGIFVKGDLVGDNLFYGQGAGSQPTSSAVLSDIVSIAQNIAGGRKSPVIAQNNDLPRITRIDEVRSRYYIRLSTSDKPGVLAKIAGILGKHGISIATVAQKGSGAGNVVPIVMMTHEAAERDMSAAIAQIDRLSVVKEKTIRVRVEG